MKDGLKDIIGKQITGVVVARGTRDPRQQVFLVFQDGTRFEFWGESFSCCGGLDEAAGILEYIEAGNGEVVQVYGDIRQAADDRVETARMNQAEAQSRALQWLAKQGSSQLKLTPLNEPYRPFYGFDPTGWIVFSVFDRSNPILDDDRYVAVHAATGAVRHV